MHETVKIIAQYFVVIPVVAWLVVLARLHKQQRVRFVLTSAAAAIVAIVLVKIATSVHTDLRPFVRDGVTPYFKSSTDNGFPSDHTTFSSLIAFVVMRYRLRLGLVLLVVAVAIGTARVIAGVHHGQDIVGGVAIAALAAGLVFGLEKPYDRTRSGKATTQ